MTCISLCLLQIVCFSVPCVEKVLCSGERQAEENRLWTQIGTKNKMLLWMQLWSCRRSPSHTMQGDARSAYEAAPNMLPAVHPLVVLSRSQGHLLLDRKQNNMVCQHLPTHNRLSIFTGRTLSMKRRKPNTTCSVCCTRAGSTQEARSGRLSLVRWTLSVGGCIRGMLTTLA